MTKSELLVAIAGLGDDDLIFVDVSPWDADLSVSPAAGAQCYVGSADDGGRPFATITPSTDGATRLDPNG